ncbi:MAG: hypothetical protein M3Y69_10865, partial [Verrucomicrobiota bacterium]|nr:hypothetical protein [Verrucomicrobiota bacterium]
MKKSLNFTRTGLLAIGAAALCLGGRAFAQETGAPGSASATSAANMESNTSTQTKATTSGSPAAMSGNMKS